ncbi:Mut7-C ubiquitin/RNAse domain-containing protein [Microbulbifer litoralis]|uniref:Mut7-C ubiquitin/RNAse domain-containing protein n=1 Tax=Microbulbifer litoralis TaxID=2933965 RepID=UPI0020283B8A|nr:Mut7-C ubiquitin/RNAse domain-containing protein [Microbulbifer sp. GX H0434]
MLSVSFHFYRELNDFLPKQWRQREFARQYPLPGSVKDAIENLGVPHIEVDLILANGVSVDFDYRLGDGDRIAVYPLCESPDISPLTRLRPAPLRRPRFVLDCHLGRLARHLRMLGFDTLFYRHCDDDTLLEISVSQRRILLSRDRGLLKHGRLQRGYFVRATAPKLQITEVVERLQLRHRFTPFSRCLACNGLLSAVDREAVLQRLPENTRRYFRDFFQCTDCARVYWKGSHYQRMQQLVRELAAR